MESVVSGIFFIAFFKSISRGNDKMFPSSSSSFIAQKINSPFSRSNSKKSETSVASTSKKTDCFSINVS